MAHLPNDTGLISEHKGLGSSSLFREEEMQMLRRKLFRRNMLLELVRRAYYHDIILVKEALRQQISTHRASNVNKDQFAAFPSSDARLSDDVYLSSIPSIDLRDFLPLFAPSGTCLRLKPCSTCGGTLELIHGETSELHKARAECERARSAESRIGEALVRLQDDLSEQRSCMDFLKLNTEALEKQLMHATNQLALTDKRRLEQEAVIGSLQVRVKENDAAQSSLVQVTTELSEMDQRLRRIAHERDEAFSSNCEVKLQLQIVSKRLEEMHADYEQMYAESAVKDKEIYDLGSAVQRLSSYLNSSQADLHEKSEHFRIMESSLAKQRDDYAKLVQTTEQIQRSLKSQLQEEMQEREMLQEQYIISKRMGNRMLKPISKIRATEGKKMSTPTTIQVSKIDIGTCENDLERKIEAISQIVDIQILTLHLERACMREQDYMCQLERLSRAKEAPLKHLEAAIQWRTRTSRHQSHLRMTNEVTGTSLIQEMKADIYDRSVKVDYAENIVALVIPTIVEESPAMITAPLSLDLPIEQQRIEVNTAAEEEQFQAYYHQLQKHVKELEEKTQQVTKQQTVISNMERKHDALIKRLDDTKASNDTLTGSLNTLNARLIQEKTIASEQIEKTMQAVAEHKRQEQYNEEKLNILQSFLGCISSEIYQNTKIPQLLSHIFFEKPQLEEPGDSQSNKGAKRYTALTPELLQRKKELREKILNEKAIAKYRQLCSGRTELVRYEIHQIYEKNSELEHHYLLTAEKLHHSEQKVLELGTKLEDLQSENEALANHREDLDMMFKSTSQELLETNARYAETLRLLDEVNAKMSQNKENECKLLMLLEEFTALMHKSEADVKKAEEKIGVMENHLGSTTAELLQAKEKISRSERIAHLRLLNRKDAQIDAVPAVSTQQMQTDVWKPEGLVLRRRNALDRLPQRYLGNTTMLIDYSTSSFQSPQNSDGKHICVGDIKLNPSSPSSFAHKLHRALEIPHEVALSSSVRTRRLTKPPTDTGTLERLHSSLSQSRNNLSSSHA